MFGSAILEQTYHKKDAFVLINVKGRFIITKIYYRVQVLQEKLNYVKFIPSSRTGQTQLCRFQRYLDLIIRSSTIMLNGKVLCTSLEVIVKIMNYKNAISNHADLKLSVTYAQIYLFPRDKYQRSPIFMKVISGSIGRIT